MASEVSFLSSSAAINDANAARASWSTRTHPSSDSDNGSSTDESLSESDFRSESTSTTSLSTMLFSVSVPVLSVQTTSTRAKPSIAGSSLTSALNFPRRTTPTAKAIDVIKTRPSGTIGTRAATMAKIASRSESPDRNS